MTATEQVKPEERFGDYVHIEEAAQILETSTDALTKKIRRGSVKAKKYGWQWLIPREVLELLQNQN